MADAEGFGALNQSLTYDIQAVMQVASDSGLFSSLCTIQTRDETLIDAGQPVISWTDLPGVVNIACMDAPLSPGRLRADEMKSMPEIKALSWRHVLLDGYFGLLIPSGDDRPAMRAVITSPSGELSAYEVMGFESDSQSVMTRLHLRILTI